MGQRRERVSSAGGENPVDDGHSWRKYGQKEILGAKHPRYGWQPSPTTSHSLRHVFIWLFFNFQSPNNLFSTCVCVCVFLSCPSFLPSGIEIICVCLLVFGCLCPSCLF